MNILLSVVFIVSVAFFTLPPEKQAVAQGVTPFGGMSAYVFYCTCSANIAVTIDDLTISPPLTLPIIFQPGATTLYPYGQIYTPGVWTLGLWQSGGNCEYYVGKGCSVYTTEGTMTMVGTSM
jgi:hypothetical protein